MHPVEPSGITSMKCGFTSAGPRIGYSPVHDIGSTRFNVGPLTTAINDVFPESVIHLHKLLPMTRTHTSNQHDVNCDHT